MDDRRLLLHVAAVGSYQAAARDLRVARTTIMRRVEALESELGLKLVARAGRGIALTEPGHQLVEGLRALYARQDKLEASLRGARDDANGTIKLCGPELGTGYGIVDVVAAFVEAFPGVRVEVQLGLDLRKLRPGEFDVAIQLGHRINPELKARVLFRERMILVASPRYLERAGEPSAIGDLAGHRAVEERDAQGRVVPWRARDGSRLTMPRSRVSANGAGVVIGLALEGAGIARVPRSLAGEAIRDERLRHVLPEVWSEDPLSLVYLPGPSAATRAFLDFMGAWDHQRRWAAVSPDKKRAAAPRSRRKAG